MSFRPVTVAMNKLFPAPVIPMTAITMSAFREAFSLFDAAFKRGLKTKDKARESMYERLGAEASLDAFDRG
jgi:hypothetical protein